MLATPLELAAGIAARARAARLVAQLTQAGLAARAGISLGSLRRFETSGQIALESLVKLALALGRERDLETLFEAPPLASLDQLARPIAARQRGRRT